MYKNGEVFTLMNELNNVFSKKDLPSRWEEISRFYNGIQLNVQIGHIDPGNKADKIWTSGMTTQVVDGQTVTVHSITQRGTMTQYFNGMMAAAQSGFVPGIKPENITAMRSQYNQVRDEKYDVDMMLSVIHYDNEALAIEALENLDPTRPKTIGGKNMAEIFSDPRIGLNLTPEQLKLMADLPALMAKMQSEIKEKNGGRYYQDTLLGYPAMLFEIDNPQYQAYIKPKPVVKRDPKKFVGGGVDTLAKPRPKPSPPSPKIVVCHGIRVGNVLVSGSLVSSIYTLPAANEFSHSLTKHETKVITEKIEGRTYTSTHFLPVDSTVAEEGFANREELTRMLQTVIDEVKSIR
jgi:hypothetical protein